MKALTRLYHDLHKLRLEISAAAAFPISGKFYQKKPRSRPRTQEAIRQAACDRMNALAKSDTFWLKAAYKKTQPLSLQNSDKTEAKIFATMLISILEEINVLRIDVPKRDATGMHLCIMHSLSDLDTQDILRYVVAASKGRMESESAAALLAFLETSRIQLHLGKKQLLRVGIALQRLKHYQCENHRRVCHIFLERLTDTLPAQSTTEIVLSMGIFSALLTKSPLWEEFFRVFLANHMEAASEEEVMRVLLCATVCRIPPSFEGHVLRQLTQRLCGLSRAPTKQNADATSKGVQISSKGSFAFASKRDVPSDALIQAALGCCLAFARSKTLRAIVRDSAPFARYLCDYFIPLCLSVGKCTEAKRGKSTARKPLTAVQAEALCVLLAEILGESSRFSPQTALHRRNAPLWWKAHLSEFLSECVIPVLPASNHAIRAVEAELAGFRPNVR